MVVISLIMAQLLPEMHQQIEREAAIEISNMEKARIAWYDCVEQAGKQSNNTDQVSISNVFDSCIDRQQEYHRALIPYYAQGTTKDVTYLADQDVEGCKKHLVKRLHRKGLN